MERLYILGRRDVKENALMNIGKYYALDGSLGSTVFIDASKPHVMLICGKRGYGKSYTMGVILEEFYSLNEKIRRNIGIVVADTLGIFWTSVFPNKKEMEALQEWELMPEGIDATIFSSPEMVENYREKGIDARELSISTSALSSFHWCNLFGISFSSLPAVAISRALYELKEEYDIDDIKEKILKDDEIDNETKLICQNFFTMAESWKIFKKKGLRCSEIVQKGKISILDLSPYPENLKAIILAVIGEMFFEERVKERKRDEERKMGIIDIESEIPLIWLAIDEAHVFLPQEEKITKEVYINRWMRQGRQPGLTLILATQRPSSLDNEVLSHADIIICHRLTTQEDIDSLNKIRPTYMKESIGEAIKKMGAEKGIAIVIDDVTEAVHVIKVRPRKSWHGGEEPSAV